MHVHVHELGDQAEAPPIGLGMLDDERLDVYQRAMEHVVYGVVPESDVAAAKLLVVRVVGMLSNLCR